MIDPLDGLRVRRPTEADHARIVRLLGEWSDRRTHDPVPRSWFRHVTGTSWVAERDDGRLAAFLVGFVSPERPAEAGVQLVATHPNLRRRGLATALYLRFLDDVAGRGVRRVDAVAWPGNRPAIALHRSLGFRADDGPGSQRLYGTPAYPDYDGEGEDRAVLVLELPAGPGRSG